MESLKRELAAALPVPCEGIEITLSFEHGDVRVSAKAPDGREASRVVRQPSGLSAVVFGLRVMAPRELQPAPPEPLELPPPPEPSPLPPVVAPFDEAKRASVSAAAGARWGLPTHVVMADFEARADLSVHHWLITLSGRLAPLSVSSRLAFDEDAYAEAAIGLGFGRELIFGRSSLELTVGPSFAYIWMESDAKNLAVEHAQLRFGATGRWAYPISRHFRGIVALDTELAPSGLSDTTAPAGLAPYPGFTVGLRFGVEAAL